MTVPGVAVGNIIAIGSIAVGTLTLLSKLPDMIPQYIFMIKPSEWGNAIGQNIGGVAAFGLAAPVAIGKAVSAGNRIAQKYGTKVPGRDGQQAPGSSNEESVQDPVEDEQDIPVEEEKEE